MNLRTAIHRAYWSGVRDAMSLRKVSDTSKVGICLAGYSPVAD